MKVNLIKVEIPAKAGQSRIDTLLDFISLWNGQPGLTVLAENIDDDSLEFYHPFCDFIRNDWEGKDGKYSLDKDTIKAIYWEDMNGNVIKGKYIREDNWLMTF